MEELQQWSHSSSWNLQLVDKRNKTFQLFTYATTGQGTTIDNVPNKRQRLMIETPPDWLSLNICWSAGIDEHPTASDAEKMCSGTDSCDTQPNNFHHSCLNIRMSHVIWYWITGKDIPNIPDMHSGLNSRRRSKNLRHISQPRVWRKETADLCLEIKWSH